LKFEFLDINETKINNVNKRGQKTSKLVELSMKNTFDE
jgi:hypothetical protein